MDVSREMLLLTPDVSRETSLLSYVSRETSSVEHAMENLYGDESGD
jgi:hypothetical protein